MADGPYGARNIEIDLNVAGARVLRDILKNELAYITGITLNGITGAGSGDICLREDSASGQIVWEWMAPAASTVSASPSFSNAIPSRGLYMDDFPGSAWLAGAKMVIHTR